MDVIWKMKNLNNIWPSFLTLCLYSSASAYVFAQTPRVDSVVPSQGPIVGGTIVTIRGTNFSAATLQVDKTNVTPMLISDSQVILQMPPHDNGYALIKIRNAAGTGYGEFLYIPPRLDEMPPGYITTIAGVGTFWGDGRPATKAMVEPTDITLDSKGNIYVGEPSQARIRRIRTDGIIEPFAGTGTEGVAGIGGPASEAQLWQARSMAIDSADNIYIANAWSHRILRVDAMTGILTAIAGTGTAGFSGDGGPALQAQFNFPNQVAMDKDGNLYVLDSGNFRIRRIARDGTISTVAGNGTPGFSGDGGPAIDAQFNINFIDNGGLAVDRKGNVYLADTDNNRVRKIDKQTGIITTFVPAEYVRAVTLDSLDNLYFASAQSQSGRIFKVSPTGQIIASWGRGVGFSEDGLSAQSAPLGFIDRVRIDQSGNILFTDFTVNRVRRINIQSGLLETVAGIGPHLIGDSGQAVAAVLNNFNSDIVFSSTSDLLIGDSGNYRLRKIDSNGTISTIAGNGLFGLTELDEIPAIETTILGIAGLELGKDGSIYVLNEHAVRRIDPLGIIHLAAGNQNRERGFSGDGEIATQARFMQIWDVVSDSNGNLYIADSNNNRIRKVDAQTSIISTVAGSGPGNEFENYGKGSFCGDGGPALQACLNTPYGVAVDREGNLFIAEGHDTRIRKVDRNGVISTFVDLKPFQANGYTTKLVFDNAGNLYTLGGSKIFRISPAGVVSRIAGPAFGGIGFSGDGGTALSAAMYAQGQAGGIAIDREGNLFFCDGGNRRIRVVKNGAVIAPPNASIQITQGASQTVQVSTPLASPLEVTVRDELGNPANGVRVDFSAPASGASSVFPNGSNSFSAYTDTSGKATIRAFTNCIAGAYEVTATPLGSSTTLRFSITNTSSPNGNPQPTIKSNSPSTAFAGGSSFTLKVVGSKFVPCSYVLWNGSPQPTLFLNDTLLAVTISTSKIDTLGAMQVTVVNPTPGGGTSQPIAFQILLAPPTLASPSDSSTGIETTPTMKWNPSPRATLYHLQVSKDSTFTTTFINDSTLTTNSKQIGPLEQGTTYFWRVRAEAAGEVSAYSLVRRFRTTGVSSVERVDGDIPKEYNLAQNFPNPFNPTTVIEFSLPNLGYVSLVVFNSLGQQVQTIIAQEIAAGRYRAQWNAVNAASGVYFYQLRAGEFVETKKLMLIR